MKSLEERIDDMIKQNSKMNAELDILKNIVGTLVDSTNDANASIMLLQAEGMKNAKGSN